MKSYFKKIFISVSILLLFFVFSQSSFAASPPPPPTPTGFKAETVSDTFIKLTWDVTDPPADKYIVWMGKTGQYAIEPPFAWTGLTPDTAYTFSLQACNPPCAVASDKSPMVSISQTTESRTPQPLLEPAVRYASTDRAITVTWGPVENATSYTVLNKTTGDGYTLQDTLYEFSNLTPSASYEIEVIASADGYTASQTTITAITKAQFPRLLQAPTDLKSSYLISGNTTDISLSWKPSSDVSASGTGYYVYDYSGFYKGSPPAIPIPVSSASYTTSDTKPSVTTTYVFGVQAYDENTASPSASEIMTVNVTVIPSIEDTTKDTTKDTTVKTKTAGSGGGDELNPLAANTIPEFICLAVSFLSTILMPPLAVLLALWAGFLYLTAAENAERIKQAHNTLIMLAIGIAILILAPALVALVMDVAKVDTASRAINFCGSKAATSTVIEVIVNLINWFAWFFSAASVGMGLYAAFLYLTSAGDPEKAKKATGVFVFTIIGVAVAILSFSIISIVEIFVG